MTQASLLDWTAPQAAPTATEQGQQIARVASGIAEHVLAFCRGKQGESFYLGELTRWVQERHGTAPSSPDRILRMLRTEGHVTYRVERSKSRYTVEWVRP